MRWMYVAIMLFCCPTIFSQGTERFPWERSARIALERGTIVPVLYWIKAEDTQAVQRAFSNALIVRKTGSDAVSVADEYFKNIISNTYLGYFDDDHKRSEVLLSATLINTALETNDQRILLAAVNDSLKELTQIHFEKIANNGGVWGMTSDHVTSYNALLETLLMNHDTSTSPGSQAVAAGHKVEDQPIAFTVLAILIAIIIILRLVINYHHKQFQTQRLKEGNVEGMLPDEDQAVQGSSS